MNSKSEIYMVEVISNGEWYPSFALNSICAGPELWAEALKFLRDGTRSYGEWVRLPSGEINAKMWRVVKYSAKRKSHKATYRFKQEDLNPLT